MQEFKVESSGIMQRASRASLLVLFPLIASAGQSLVLTPSQSLNIVDPTLPSTQSWRVEFQLHNLVPPAPPTINGLFWMSGTGLHTVIFPDGSINLSDVREVVNGNTPCQVFTNNLTDVLVRFQRDIVLNRITCELWNFDGTGYNSEIEPITTLNPGYSDSGGNIGLGVTGDLGFLRVLTTIVPLGSRPPTTADAGDWTEWKFDGNLNDSSGHNHMLSGPATYVSTPDQVPVALPKTLGAPSWSNWVSLRAGFPGPVGRHRKLFFSGREFGGNLFLATAKWTHFGDLDEPYRAHACHEWPHLRHVFIRIEGD